MEPHGQTRGSIIYPVSAKVQATLHSTRWKTSRAADADSFYPHRISLHKCKVSSVGRCMAGMEVRIRLALDFKRAMPISPATPGPRS